MIFNTSLNRGKESFEENKCIYGQNEKKKDITPDTTKKFCEIKP